MFELKLYSKFRAASTTVYDTVSKIKLSQLIIIVCMCSAP